VVGNQIGVDDSNSYRMVAVTAVHLACIGAREIGSERTAFCIVVLDHEGTRHRRAYPGPALPQWDADLGDTSPGSVPRSDQMRVLWRLIANLSQAETLLFASILMIPTRL
jgi:hypothetical protein